MATIIEGRETPCRNCSNRTVGCHSICVDYTSWIKNIADQKKLLKADKVGRGEVLGYFNDLKRKRDKEKRKHGK